MDRQKAIETLENGYSRYIGEFCIGKEESDQAEAEMVEAFGALGVSPVEIPGTDEWYAKLKESL